MGQGLSCGETRESGLFEAVENGDLEVLEDMVEADPSVLEQRKGHAKLSAMHVAAANGQIEVGFV